MTNFFTEKNKCNVEGIVVEKSDKILLAITLLLALVLTMILVLVVALTAIQKCNCTCDKKIDEIVDKQNTLSTSLNVRRTMDARNIANERMTQNARMMRAIDTVASRLGENRE